MPVLVSKGDTVHCPETPDASSVNAAVLLPDEIKVTCHRH
jgi:hypothetical protein